ncbi:MAG: AI-2E family transporter [Draconibacterium sp.]|nr:AI-2E family transporter [Draconibacterium sp.]
MSDSKLPNKFVLKSIEFYVKTALVFLIIYTSFIIFKPFLLPFIWGIIIAVALYPLHKKLTRLLKNKSGLSATIITLVLLAVLLAPSASFTSSLVDSIRELKTGVEDGTLVIPSPTDDVVDWPIIGKRVHVAWQSFSDNITVGIVKHKEQLKIVGGKFISLLSGFVGSMLTFVIAIIIAGIFLGQSSKGYQYVNTVFTALAGNKGDEMVENSRATISSVVFGILGTAIIQTIIIASAFFVFDVPGAPILTIIVLFFAIAQIPAILVVLPVMIFMFSHL